MSDHPTHVIGAEKYICKIRQIGYVPVFDIGPEKGLLEWLVAIVGVVFGIDAIADDEYLYILEQATVGPERMPLVAVDLVKGFFQFQSPAFELDLHQKKAVNEQGYIVAVFVGAFLRNLVGDLKKVVAPIFTVVKTDVGTIAIVTVKLKAVTKGFGFLEYIALSQVVEDGAEFLFGKSGVIEGFQLAFQVGQYAFFIIDMNVSILQAGQLLDQIVF